MRWVQCPLFLLKILSICVGGVLILVPALRPPASLCPCLRLIDFAASRSEVSLQGLWPLSTVHMEGGTRTD